MPPARSLRIYTCALKPFEANDYFFTRDSGLLCRSLQNIGVESKVIMPRQDNGQKELSADVIRGTLGELQSAVWWRNLRIDAVVIVTWGHAENTPLIRAAKEAGIKIILVTDDGEGARTKLVDLLQITWQKLYHLPKPRRMVETLAKFPFLYVWLAWKKHGSYPQYRYADMITCWTARIARNVRQGLQSQITGMPEFLLGYPCSTDANQIFTDKDPSKPPSVLAVARWDAVKHKRPHFLMDVCRTLLKNDVNITIHIYGVTLPFMHHVHDGLPKSQWTRLFLHGFRDNSEILARMRESEVAICPSAGDCGPVPMAEALCQGCSLVGYGNVAEWAAKTGYGTAVPLDTPGSFSEAVIREIQKWKGGNYSRQNNAAFWREHYSATRIAGKIRDFVESGAIEPPLA